MTNAATEIVYVYAAYAAAAIIVTSISLLTLLDARRQRNLLAEIEARGIRRRSSTTPS